MDSSSSSKTPFAGNSNIMLDLNQLPEEDHEALSDQVSQPYRSNNHVVLALTPGLHSGSKTKDDETTCRTCKRKLIEYHLYSYCSIACKIEAFTKKAIYDSPPFLSLELLEPKVIQDSELKMVVALPATKQDSEKKTIAVYQLAQNVEIEPQMANLDQSAKKPKQEPETKMAVPEPSVRMANQEKNLSYRTRRRKGYPQRSPLF